MDKTRVPLPLLELFGIPILKGNKRNPTAS
jgi:hypothetical protein